jgi:hypothetical protein
VPRATRNFAGFLDWFRRVALGEGVSDTVPFWHGPIHGRSDQRIAKVRLLRKTLIEI